MMKNFKYLFFAFCLFGSLGCMYGQQSASNSAVYGHDYTFWIKAEATGFSGAGPAYSGGTLTPSVSLIGIPSYSNLANLQVGDVYFGANNGIYEVTAATVNGGGASATVDLQLLNDPLLLGINVTPSGEGVIARPSSNGLVPPYVTDGGVGGGIGYKLESLMLNYNYARLDSALNSVTGLPTAVGTEISGTETVPVGDSTQTVDELSDYINSTVTQTVVGNSLTVGQLIYWNGTGPVIANQDRDFSSGCDSCAAYVVTRKDGDDIFYTSHAIVPFTHSFTEGSNLYLADNGAYTDTPPTSNYIQSVGFALPDNEVYVRIGDGSSGGSGGSGTDNQNVANGISGDGTVSTPYRLGVSGNDYATNQLSGSNTIGLANTGLDYLRIGSSGNSFFEVAGDGQVHIGNNSLGGAFNVNVTSLGAANIGLFRTSNDGFGTVSVSNINTGTSSRARVSVSSLTQSIELGVNGDNVSTTTRGFASESYLYGTEQIMYSSASNTGHHRWAIGTGINEKMRLTTTGLGLGTTSPHSGLEVDGTFALSHLDVTTNGVNIEAKTNVIVDASSAVARADLPTAVGIEGRIYIVTARNITNGASISTNGAETILGGTTYTFTESGEVLAIQSDGANWEVVFHYKPSLFSSTSSNRTISNAGSTQAGGASDINATVTIDDVVDNGTPVTYQVPAGLSDGDEITFFLSSSEAGGDDGLDFDFVANGYTFQGVLGLPISAQYNTLTLQYINDGTTNSIVLKNKNF